MNNPTKHQDLHGEMLEILLNIKINIHLIDELNNQEHDLIELERVYEDDRSTQLRAVRIRRGGARMKIKLWERDYKVKLDMLNNVK